MANLFKANQYVSTTLATAGGIDDSQTTDIELQSVTGIDTAEPGICCISYSSPVDTDNAEWVTYTSINSGTKKLEGVTRGAEGFSAKSHAYGVTVAFPISESHINNLVDALSIGGDSTDGVTTTLDEDDMASNSATSLATQQSIKAMHDTGWTAITETFTYASATTITIATGGASRYQKGDKLKLTQTTDKYFYIVKVEDELLTITGGSDYTLDDAAITSPQLSRIETPFGFPGWFNFTPSYGYITSVTTYIAIFKIAGEFCTYNIFFNGTTESAAAYLAVSYPVGAPQNSFWIPVFVRDSTRYAGLSECTTSMQRFHKGNLGSFGVGGNRGGSCSNTYRYVI